MKPVNHLEDTSTAMVKITIFLNPNCPCAEEEAVTWLLAGLIWPPTALLCPTGRHQHCCSKGNNNHHREHLIRVACLIVLFCLLSFCINAYCRRFYQSVFMNGARDCAGTKLNNLFALMLQFLVTSKTSNCSSAMDNCQTVVETCQLMFLGMNNFKHCNWSVVFMLEFITTLQAGWCPKVQCGH